MISKKVITVVGLCVFAILTFVFFFLCFYRIGHWACYTGGAIMCATIIFILIMITMMMLPPPQEIEFKE